MRPNYDVIMLVMNGVTSDSRVLRTARTVVDCGLSLLLLGLGPRTKDGPALAQLPMPGFHAYLVSAPDLPAAEPGSPAQGARHEALIASYEQRVLDIVGAMSPRFVHTHDMTTIAVGGALKRHFADRGRRVPWIHDLHEWVGGLTTISPSIRKVSADHERTWIRHADALTTVSPAIAKILTSEYALATAPQVVLNTPRLSDHDPALSPTLRDVLGLNLDTPLAVYCGQVKEPRGVHDVVDLLIHDTDVHVALVSNNRGTYVDGLLETAEANGTSDRLHLLPYVDQQAVSSFIRTADIGIHPLRRYGNGDVALPNKLFEYLHASLPVVVSDCRAMATFVTDHRIGSTYPSGEVPALAAAVRGVLANRAEYARNAGNLRARYAWETQEQILRKVYADLLGVGAIAVLPPVDWPPPPPPPSDGPGALSVLHGIAGSANQPGTLAAALRRRGHRAYNVVTSVPRMGFTANALVPLSRMSTHDQFRMIRSLAEPFDVIHLHARPFLLHSRTFRFPSYLDILLLRLLGKIVVFHFRGSEARLASEFSAANPFSYAGADPYGMSQAYPETAQRLLIQYVSSLAHAVYTTDPELHAYVPGSEIVPRAIDLSLWQPKPDAGRARPLVVHAPTRPEIKGSHHIQKAVEQLRGRGLSFDFVQTTDIDHATARALYERADVIIDQLLIGWYGVLAVEAMALGKAVVSHVRPDLVHHLGRPAPLALADPTSIQDVLHRLITSPSERRHLGEAGRAYVERVHDADAIAADLELRYRGLIETAPERGADYAGIAALFEHQAAHATQEAQRSEHARRILKQAERLLDSGAGDEAVILGKARKQIRAARRALDPGAAATDGPVTTERSADKSARAGRSGDVATPARSPEAVLSEALATGGLTAATIRRRVAKNASWRELLERLRDQPATAADLMDDLARSKERGSEDVLGALVGVLDQLLETRDEGLVLPGIPVRPEVQVRLARHVYNRRGDLGDRATSVSAACLRPVIRMLERPDEARAVGWDLERLQTRAWFFINSAAPGRTLDADAADAYARGVAAFAADAHRWDVPAFRTTRASLRASLPLRIVLATPAAAGAESGPTVRLESENATLDLARVYDRATGALEAIEGTVETEVADRPIALRLILTGSPAVRVDILLPNLAFDPLRATPRISGWAVGATADVDDDRTTVRLELDRDLLARTGELTHFSLVDGRLRSTALNRQIEQMETLARVHTERRFAERAAVWRAYRDAWATSVTPVPAGSGRILP